MKAITVKDLKEYLDKCPDEAIVKLGIKRSESHLVDILKSPLNDDEIRLVDMTYLEDCKKI